MNDYERWAFYNMPFRLWKYRKITRQDWFCAFGLHKYRIRTRAGKKEKVCEHCGKMVYIK